MAEISVRHGDFHLPVLVDEILDYFDVDRPKLIVDATLGDGGHALAMLERMPAASLVGIDADPQSLQVARLRLKHLSNRVQFKRGNFRQLSDLLATINLDKVDRILADLGVSSRQIDVPERGMSYNHEGPLDLRLDPSLQQTAAELLAALDQDDLVRLLRDYGEEKLARPIAKAIVERRRRTPIATTSDLRDIVGGVVRGPHRIKSFARVFQALRIAVNDELGALRDFLDQSAQVLPPGGRLAIISYHSLEDRMVKQHFKHLSLDCVCPPELPVCRCGKQSEAVVLTRKPVRPGAKETKRNPRSRSARLRVLQKR